jgi:hypothetical protein
MCISWAAKIEACLPYKWQILMFMNWVAKIECCLQKMTDNNVYQLGGKNESLSPKKTDNNVYELGGKN